jgi:beta-glucosidase
MKPFPKNFVWGVATAAYQIEGAAAIDGRGPSVWDSFCQQKTRVFESNDGDVACDHYHRWREDIALMKSLGVPHYRLSVSWPRVLPQGTGAVNEKGLAFYDQLVDGLLEVGITPWVTLFHWDFPQTLYRQGGWLNPKSPDWFADYTRVLVDRLSDRVTHWMTHNEPQCFVGLGLRDGVQAPGDKLGWSDIAAATHNVLLAHGRAIRVLREHAKRPAEVGLVMAAPPACGIDDSPASAEAARVATFRNKTLNSWNASWWTDPACLGHYPDDLLKLLGKDAPAFTQSDMDIISTPSDFIGLNTYSGNRVKMGSDGQPESLPFEPGFPNTHFGWKVLPEALYWGPKLFHDRYKLPIYITENGLASHDWVALDGKVHDPARIDFLHRYLREFRRAGDAGADIRGYFAWSFMDNFEWAEGYKYRFGLVHVDFATQVRTPKDSAYWYKDVIASNGAML